METYAPGGFVDKTVFSLDRLGQGMVGVLSS